MTAILISDAEWELLAGEPAELLKLYAALKRRMDFSTGIAGIKTLINEIVLREGFTVDPIPGRAAPRPYTREMGRSAIRRLEKIGAIKVIGSLIFEFPHARRDQSVQNSYNQAATKLQPRQQPSEKPLEASKHAASTQCDGGAETGLFLEQLPSCNLLPDSGNTSTATSSPRTSRDPPDRFPMHDAWLPSPDGWPATLARNAMRGYPLRDDDLLEFRSYWITRPDKPKSQGQWEHELAQTLKRKRRREETRSNHGLPTESGITRARGRFGQRSLSAAEQVDLAIEEQRAELAKACGTTGTGLAGEPMADHGPDLWPPLDGEFWRDT